MSLRSMLGKLERAAAAVVRTQPTPPTRKPRPVEPVPGYNRVRPVVWRANYTWQRMGGAPGTLPKRADIKRRPGQSGLQYIPRGNHTLVAFYPEFVYAKTGSPAAYDGAELSIILEVSHWFDELDRRTPEARSWTLERRTEEALRMHYAAKARERNLMTGPRYRARGYRADVRMSGRYREPWRA